MKVLFIYPNTESQPGFNYGIAQLSAVLKQAGHCVELLHICEDLAPLPSEDEFIGIVRASAPGLIGFSVVTNQWPVAKQLASWARQATDAPLICGGIHAMAAPQQILETGLFDYIIRGEAESALLDLVENKIVRVMDLVVVQKDEDGNHEALELEQLDDEIIALFDPLELEISGIVQVEDIDAIAEGMENNTTVAILLFENLWAIKFKEAVHNANGRLLVQERIPEEVVEETLEIFAREESA